MVFRISPGTQPTRLLGQCSCPRMTSPTNELWPVHACSRRLGRQTQGRRQTCTPSPLRRCWPVPRPQVKKMPRPVAKPSPKVQASTVPGPKGVKPSQAPGLSASSSSEPSPWDEEQQCVHPDHDMHTRLVLTPGCQSLCRVCLSLSVRTKSVTESVLIINS